jgi:hypothetical protein
MITLAVLLYISLGGFTTYIQLQEMKEAKYHITMKDTGEALLWGFLLFPLTLVGWLIIHLLYAAFFLAILVGIVLIVMYLP